MEVLELDITDAQGNKLLCLMSGEEHAVLGAEGLAPLTHALVIACCAGKALLAFNKYKQYWELPGGIIDPGESARECASREFFEETGQRVQGLHFIGLMKVSLAKDNRIEFGALYGGELKGLGEFKENDEIEKIRLWQIGTAFDGSINKIDRALVERF